MENPFRPKHVNAQIVTECDPFEMFMAKVAGSECVGTSGPYKIRGYFYKEKVYPTHFSKSEVTSPPPSQH